jgi:hypothetical protein
MALKLLIEASQMNCNPQTELPGVVSNQDVPTELERNTHGNGSRFLRSRMMVNARQQLL